MAYIRAGTHHQSHWMSEGLMIKQPHTIGGVNQYKMLSSKHMLRQPLTSCTLIEPALNKAARKHHAQKQYQLCHHQQVVFKLTPLQNSHHIIIMYIKIFTTCLKSG